MRRRLRGALRRRERVVPVVLRSTRRRWARAGPDDWASRLHLLYLRHRDQWQPAYFARLRAYPMPRRGLPRWWRWYASDVLVQAVRLARRRGAAVRRSAGVPVRRQLREMLRLSVTVPAMPEHYYTFEWYLPEHRARANDYLHRYETKGGLYAMLSGGADLGEQAPLNDKVAFADHAARAGLPVVPTVAVVGDGAPAGGGAGGGAPGGDELPAQDLFVKPRDGKGGRDVHKWRYAPEENRFHAAAAPDGVPRAALREWLDEQAGDRQLVVQPCLTNHPDLRELALDAVATCRIITILDERGDPEPVVAIFRMPAVRGTVVDNMHRGGLAAPVDVGSGVLDAAAGYVATGEVVWHRRHPASGAPIEGRTLPDWPATRDLAVRAHAAFRPRVLVGWDICVGPDGPVLVEGNEQPGVDGLQRLHRQPLGAHRFGELLHHHLSTGFATPAASGRQPAVAG